MARCPHPDAACAVALRLAARDDAVIPDGDPIALVLSRRDALDGFLSAMRYLIMDRDPLFTRTFRETLKAAGADYLLPGARNLPELIFNEIQPRLMQGALPGQGRA